MLVCSLYLFLACNRQASAPILSDRPQVRDEQKILYAWILLTFGKNSACEGKSSPVSDQGELLCGGLERGRTLLLMVYLCSFIFKWQLSEAVQCLEREIKSQERWIRG